MVSDPIQWHWALCGRSSWGSFPVRLGTVMIFIGRTVCVMAKKTSVVACYEAGEWTTPQHCPDYCICNKTSVRNPQNLADSPRIKSTSTLLWPTFHNHTSGLGLRMSCKAYLGIKSDAWLPDPFFKQRHKSKCNSAIAKIIKCMEKVAQVLASVNW